MSRLQRGSTSLLELLAVVALTALLVPVILGILTESQNRLSPAGKAGQEIRIYQTGSAVFDTMQRDLDRATGIRNRFGEYSGKEYDLILEQGENVVVYHWSYPKLHRIQFTGDERYEQLLTRKLGMLDWKFRDNLLEITIELAGRKIEDPAVRFTTAFALSGLNNVK